MTRMVCFRAKPWKPWSVSLVNEEGSRLGYEVVVTDAWLFTEPVTLSKSWRWIPRDAVLPFECTEA